MAFGGIVPLLLVDPPVVVGGLGSNGRRQGRMGTYFCGPTGPGGGRFVIEGITHSVADLS